LSSRASILIFLQRFVVSHRAALRCETRKGLFGAEPVGEKGDPHAVSTEVPGREASYIRRHQPGDGESLGHLSDSDGTAGADESRGGPRGLPILVEARPEGARRLLAPIRG